tara:strand:- start:43 stop:828 length:786 start_codon:yes stop_codon:yes gene_type:complete
MDNFDYRKFVYSQSLTKDEDTKQTLNENAPGYDTRKFGEALPTLESVKAAHEAKEKEELKEDVSSRFMKKYLTLPPPDEDYKNNDEYLVDAFGIEDLESYSDRDKAILIFLDDQHGISLSDKLAKGIKGLSSADIVKYFKDRDYEYMNYGVMKRQLGIKEPVVTALTWDETGGPRGSEDAFYYSTNHKRKLNKVWRTKYPELEIPKWNSRYKNYDTREKIAQELEDYYREQARKQKGVDLEVPYEEYADMYVQALKDEGAI